MPYSVYPELRVRRAGRARGEMRHGRRLLGPLLVRVRGDARELQDPAPGARADARRDEIIGKVPRKFKPPERARPTCRVESARGDMGCYVVGDGKARARTGCTIRTGSFTAMGIIEQLSRGPDDRRPGGADRILDVVAPEIDR